MRKKYKGSRERLSDRDTETQRCSATEDRERGTEVRRGDNPLAVGIGRKKTGAAGGDEVGGSRS